MFKSSAITIFKKICKGRTKSVMEHTDENLFQIGEVTKALGVTRRTLIRFR